MSLHSPIIRNDSKCNIDEHQWVIQIRQTLEEEDEEEDNGEFPVSIFNVPKPLVTTHPDSYIPQQVAIGPYYYWRPELIGMERVKLAATKRLKKNLETSLKLEHFVDQLKKSELRIRSCYNKYLNFNGETLIWMMVVDASFLLEFLQEGRVIDYSRRKLLAHNETLRDIVKLENQIPLFVLRKILEFKLSSLELADDVLLAMFMKLFREISPFEIIKEEHPEIQISQRAHLLDFLYEMIVPKLEEKSDIEELEDQNRDKEGYEKSFVNYVKQVLSEIWRMVSKLTKSSICFLEKVVLYIPIKTIICVPWTIISNLPAVGIIRHPLEHLFFSQEKEQSKPETRDSSHLLNRPPLMEEITIPCVTDLSNSGICFSPTKGGILSITFDAETATLHLPTIGVDMNTRVLLGNLVAYEASMACGPLVFSRYTELMNGIIDSEEDVKILRESGIVVNHLKSDEEVAELWNGMSRSIKLTKVHFLDEVIEDVNKYYNGRISVKAWRFMRLYVFGSWQFLTVLVVIFILLLMSLQAFCSFYRCNSRSHVKTNR